MPRFSIITPVHVWNEYRKNSLLRAIESVKNQTFQDFEHIIINDGSPVAFEVPNYEWIKVITKTHEERIIAYNAGFKEATGQYFCLLDSDDEYEKTYLERFNYHIKRHPKYRLFNCGARYDHKDGNVSTRNAFRPKKEAVGHEVFSGGNIVNGTFVWKKEVYDKLGAYPEATIQNIDCSEINYGGVRDLFMGTPYDFSAMAQLEFPEIRQYFMVDHDNEPHKIIKELGNPWGNDFYLFYKYTRRWHSYAFDEYLYIVHPKTGIE